TIFCSSPDPLLIVRSNGLRHGQQRGLIAKSISAGTHFLLQLAAMHVTFFHLDPKRPEERNRKPKTKNQRRENQPASPLVSQKGHDGGRNADDQDHGAEHSVGMA